MATSGDQTEAYFATVGTGTIAVPMHFPVAVLVPIKRPEASRCVLVADAVPLVTVLPVRRPEASRYWVWMLAPVPPLIRVAALPVSRPLASR